MIDKLADNALTLEWKLFQEKLAELAENVRKLKENALGDFEDILEVINEQYQEDYQVIKEQYQPNKNGPRKE